MGEQEPFEKKGLQAQLHAESGVPSPRYASLAHESMVTQVPVPPPTPVPQQSGDTHLQVQQHANFEVPWRLWAARTHGLMSARVSPSAPAPVSDRSRDVCSQMQQHADSGWRSWRSVTSAHNSAMVQTTQMPATAPGLSGDMEPQIPLHGTAVTQSSRGAVSAHEFTTAQASPKALNPATHQSGDVRSQMQQRTDWDVRRWDLIESRTSLSLREWLRLEKACPGSIPLQNPSQHATSSARVAGSDFYYTVARSDVVLDGRTPPIQIRADHIQALSGSDIVYTSASSDTVVNGRKHPIQTRADDVQDRNIVHRLATQDAVLEQCIPHIPPEPTESRMSIGARERENPEGTNPGLHPSPTPFPHVPQRDRVQVAATPSGKKRGAGRPRIHRTLEAAKAAKRASDAESARRRRARVLGVVEFILDPHVGRVQATPSTLLQRRALPMQADPGSNGQGPDMYGMRVNGLAGAAAAAQLE
jgi:hypothetical protein